MMCTWVWCSGCDFGHYGFTVLGRKVKNHRPVCTVLWISQWSSETEENITLEWLSVATDNPRVKLLRCPLYHRCWHGFENNVGDCDWKDFLVLCLFLMSHFAVKLVTNIMLDSFVCCYLTIQCVSFEPMSLLKRALQIMMKVPNMKHQHESPKCRLSFVCFVNIDLTVVLIYCSYRPVWFF